MNVRSMNNNRSSGLEMLKGVSMYVFPGSLAAPGLAGVPRLLSVWETIFSSIQRERRKEKELPVHHKLEELLDEYLALTKNKFVVAIACQAANKFGADAVKLWVTTGFVG